MLHFFIIWEKLSSSATTSDVLSSRVVQHESRKMISTVADKEQISWLLFVTSVHCQVYLSRRGVNTVCHEERLEALSESRVSAVDGNRVMNIMCNLE